MNGGFIGKAVKGTTEYRSRETGRTYRIAPEESPWSAARGPAFSVSVRYEKSGPFESLNGKIYDRYGAIRAIILEDTI